MLKISPVLQRCGCLQIYPHAHINVLVAFAQLVDMFMKIQLHVTGDFTASTQHEHVSVFKAHFCRHNLKQGNIASEQAREKYTFRN